MALRKGREIKGEAGTGLVHVGDKVIWCDKSGHLVRAMIEEIDPQQTKARIRANGRLVWVCADEIRTAKEYQP
jgi:hypothetical protein